MQPNRQRRRLGKENLERIIDLCRSLEERGLDPFLVNVDKVLEVIHEYFPEWKSPEELCLDAEAVHQIASALKLQSEWIKHRSSALYTDPLLFVDKLRRLSKEEICTIFLKSWHPVVELEQISPSSLEEAMKYWKSLVPLNERWQRLEGLHGETGTATPEELLRQQIIAEKEFSKELEKFWHELKRKAVGKEKIEYWDFVGADTYEETVRRAYKTSFLATYGYATLEVDRLEEIVYIIPFDVRISMPEAKHVISLPISITIENWKNWKDSGKD
ncbi:MAG: hypothetical protein JSW72_07020 [Candidatus Bathyarchaeota archaeon]|nr:MAG: hypothetical protein JSW72_07020 [Candidatus Bathyarchaeota archaeon]